MDSDLWRQIMTDILGLPLQKPLLSEQAGVGAALIAGVGAGIYSSFVDAKARVARYSAPTLPDPARHAFYNERYAQFVSLYPTLKDDMHRLS
jgi:sugar (pentulose or hexulose) kinase